MKPIAPLLLLLVSLTVAQNSSPGYDGDYSVETIDYLSSEVGVNPFEAGMCTMDKQCPKGDVCFRFFCMKDHPSLYPKTLCRDKSQCKKNELCFTHSCVKDPHPEPTCTGDAKYCIAPETTAEASPNGDSKCKTNADCGKGGKCLSGLCLASDKRRLTRRSLLTEDDKLKARAPQGLLCHSNEECPEPGQEGGFCNHGICVADPPRKGSLRNVVESRSPQLVCHSDEQCSEPDSPGYCYNGICVAEPPKATFVKE